MVSEAEELYQTFRRNFPHTVREEATARRILGDSENQIIKEKDGETLYGTLVLHKNNVLMLAVEKAYRGKGIGSRLLQKAETIVKNNGYKEISVGVGDEYLAPGVPTGKIVYPEKLKAERIYLGEDDAAARFFEKRGYYHAEDNANIFDMRLDWEDYPENDLRIGKEKDGILYRFASIADMDEIRVCTDDAEESFTKYYMQPERYESEKKRVLVAEKDGEIVGTLMVEAESESEGLGSVGCTTVKHAYRGRHIAADMVMLGTGYLKKIGMQSAYLGYTYSGLDKLYGASGYKICIYYFMAHKNL